MDDRAAAPATAPTARSVAFGLIAGTLICLFTPYNDLAMLNTPLVGNSLPLGATFVTFAFITTVNAALHRWRPRRAWSGYEVALAFALMMVMGSMASNGLMRYLLPNLAVPFRTAVDTASYRDVIASLGLKSWVFPTFTTPGRVGDPVAVGFFDGWQGTSTPPYAAWVTPFFAWAIFIGGLACTLICLSTIVLRQWRDNEHLTFPLATVQLALLEPPERGRAWNRLLRSRGFWVAFVAVFLLHLNNGLAVYFPKYVPAIPRSFDFIPVLTERPWNFCDGGFLKNWVYFSLIGVTYFLSMPVAFSLWASVVILQIYKMILGTQTGDGSVPGLGDQRFGVAIAMLLAIAWLGRRQWALVVRQGLRGPRDGEPRGDYLSYRAAFWGVVGGIAVMVGWLAAAGTSVVGALVIVLTLLCAFILVTRVVAETGLLHPGMPVSAIRPFELANGFGGPRVSLDTFYAGALLQATFYDHRETLPVYATHGLKNLDALRDDTGHDSAARAGRRVIAWIAVALVLAYAASFWSSLWTHYHYSATLDARPNSPIDGWGTRDNPRAQLIDPAVSHQAATVTATHDRAANLTLGFGAAVALTTLRLYGWPLHPVGYLIAGLAPSFYFWFSIFLGWLAKFVVLRLGGASLYERGKPIFVGMILGETGAAAAWLIASHALRLFGVPYQSYLVLPQ